MAGPFWQRALAACMLPWLLFSCIDGHEEIQLHRDGSGSAHIRYSLPAAATFTHGSPKRIEATIRNYLESSHDTSIRRIEVIESNGRLLITTDVDFHSHLAFNQLASAENLNRLPPAARQLVGESTLLPSFRQLEFQRSISLANSIPRMAGAAASSTATRGHKLTYIVHLPDQPILSNATKSENNGLTQIWEFPLDQALTAQGIQINLILPGPLTPWKIIRFAAPLAIIAVLFLAFIIRSKRQENP